MARRSKTGPRVIAQAPSAVEAIDPAQWVLARSNSASHEREFF
jgi:hypothetical protein